MIIYHKHHIVPRHMGGTDDPNNIIELTVEEHAEAHRILYEKYNKKQDYLAWKGLLGILSQKEILSQLTPHNKITETYTIICEFCGEHKTYTAYNLKRGRNKTCGSKSCAGKWSVKYRKTNNVPSGWNKINDVHEYNCEYCHKTNILPATKRNMQKRFCDRSCAASYSNLKR